MTNPVELDESAAPLPRPTTTPRGSLGSLLFRPPAPEDDPIPSPSPEPTTSHDPRGSSPSGSESSADPLQLLEDDDLTSSPGSWAADDDEAGTKPLLPLVSKSSLKKTFRSGVQITGGVAHRFGARTPGQQAVGLYLADDDDAAGIGDPLAEIASRRDAIGGKLSPDANNALQAAMAFGGYVAKQIAGLKIAAEHDAAFTGGQSPQQTPGEQL
jgi:hypothetical protein